jgi:hypothetical protein
MEVPVDKLSALALQVAKEIVVKFVETGRISPGNFAEHFGPIYDEVLRVISREEPPARATDQDGPDRG